MPALTITLNDRKISIVSYRSDDCHCYKPSSHVVSA